MSKGQHYFEQQLKHKEGQISDLKEKIKGMKTHAVDQDRRINTLVLESQEWARKYRAEVYNQKQNKKAEKA